MELPSAARLMGVAEVTPPGSSFKKEASNSFISSCIY
jgi:hypothetical protein